MQPELLLPVRVLLREPELPPVLLPQEPELLLPVLRLRRAPRRRYSVLSLLLLKIGEY